MRDGFPRGAAVRRAAARWRTAACTRQYRISAAARRCRDRPWRLQVYRAAARRLARRALHDCAVGNTAELAAAGPVRAVASRPNLGRRQPWPALDDAANRAAQRPPGRARPVSLAASPELPDRRSGNGDFAAGLCSRSDCSAVFGMQWLVAVASHPPRRRRARPRQLSHSRNPAPPQPSLGTREKSYYSLIITKRRYFLGYSGGSEQKLWVSRA